MNITPVLSKLINSPTNGAPIPIPSVYINYHVLRTTQDDTYTKFTITIPRPIEFTVNIPKPNVPGILRIHRGRAQHFTIRIPGLYEKPEERVPIFFVSAPARSGKAGIERSNIGGYSQEEELERVEEQEAENPEPSRRKRHRNDAGGNNTGQPGGIQKEKKAVKWTNAVDEQEERKNERKLQREKSNRARNPMRNVLQEAKRRLRNKSR